jgi:hypothetical protein
MRALCLIVLVYEMSFDIGSLVTGVIAGQVLGFATAKIALTIRARESWRYVPCDVSPIRPADINVQALRVTIATLESSKR